MWKHFMQIQFQLLSRIFHTSNKFHFTYYSHKTLPKVGERPKPEIILR